MRAFSLVELSIVLVILGLLTGGILSGQALIRAAELRSIPAEYQRYITAAHSFRDRYMGWPGDLPNAIRFWGAADNGDGIGSDCFNAVSTDMKTCNGNGDGSIAELTSYAFEPYRFWQHMANAGLIEGSYTGAPDGIFSAGPPWARQATPGINIPAGRLSNSGWYIYRYQANGLNPWNVSSGWKHTMLFGKEEASDILEVPILKPEEAWSIDTKLDDGNPGTGKVASIPGFPNCADTVDTAQATTARYLLTSSTVACVMAFDSL